MLSTCQTLSQTIHPIVTHLILKANTMDSVMVFCLFLPVFQRTKLSFTKVKHFAHSHMLLRAGIGLDPNNMDLELESEL